MCCPHNVATSFALNGPDNFLEELQLKNEKLKKHKVEIKKNVCFMVIQISSAIIDIFQFHFISTAPDFYDTFARYDKSCTQ